VLAALPDVHLVVSSSCDVYRAYSSLHHDVVTDAVPLDESSPVRTEPYPYRGQIAGMEDYEKLHVEERVLARGAIVLRFGAVYGEHTYQHREWFVLRRVAAGRRRIPIGTGTFVFSRVYVTDVARAVRLAVESDVRGEIFNITERRTPSIGLLARQILDACGSGAELVCVPDEALPPDLRITRVIAQDLLVDSAKARRKQKTPASMRTIAPCSVCEALGVCRLAVDERVHDDGRRRVSEKHRVAGLHTHPGREVTRPVFAGRHRRERHTVAVHFLDGRAPPAELNFRRLCVEVDRQQVALAHADPVLPHRRREDGLHGIARSQPAHDARRPVGRHCNCQSDVHIVSFNEETAGRARGSETV
jgi:hypothetical protein